MAKWKQNRKIATLKVGYMGYIVIWFPSKSQENYEIYWNADIDNIESYPIEGATYPPDTSVEQVKSDALSWAKAMLENALKELESVQETTGEF